MESKRFWISWLDFFAHFVSTTLRISNWTLQKRLGEWLCFSQGTNQCDHPKIFRRAGGTLHCSAWGGGKGIIHPFCSWGKWQKTHSLMTSFFLNRKGSWLLTAVKVVSVVGTDFSFDGFQLQLHEKTCHAWEQCDARSSTHLFGTFECQTSAITNGFYVQVHK